MLLLLYSIHLPEEVPEEEWEGGEDLLAGPQVLVVGGDEGDILLRGALLIQLLQHLGRVDGVVEHSLTSPLIAF